MMLDMDTFKQALHTAAGYVRDDDGITWPSHFNQLLLSSKEITPVRACYSRYRQHLNSAALRNTLPELLLTRGTCCWPMGP